MIERIICAAIWLNDGIKREHLPVNLTTGFCVGGWRHGNCWNTIHDLVPLDKWRKHPHIMGFLTSTGRFLGRQDAFEVAVAAGQVEARPLTQERIGMLAGVGLPHDTREALVSEDLY